jgi:hypothetical protein
MTEQQVASPATVMDSPQKFGHRAGSDNSLSSGDNENKEVIDPALNLTE